MNKKLIEVAIPLEAINKESSREKSIRHGHPSTLHLWWARRPLATARAVIFASLVDDPSSHPELYPTEDAQNSERNRLFQIIEELITWENGNDQGILNKARNEIEKYVPGTIELLDPFAGGGAIPLEASRLGLHANAHDLNPVAVLINKCMIEFPNRFKDFGPINPISNNNRLKSTYSGNDGLAEDIRYYGNKLKELAWQKLEKNYPKVINEDGDESDVIAWIWARTIECPNPLCRCNIPLVRSTTLSTKKQEFIKIELDDDEPLFTITKTKPAIESTIGRKGAICPKCNNIVQFKPYIYEQFRTHSDTANLMCIVTESKKGGKQYLNPTEAQIKASKTERPEIPDIKIEGSTGNLNVINYGFNSFSQLFTDRQLNTLVTFSKCLEQIQSLIVEDANKLGKNYDTGVSENGKGALAYSQVICTYLAFVIDKMADYNSSICSWHSSRELIRNTFGRQAIPMVWDYTESNPFSDSAGSFNNMLEWVVRCVDTLPTTAIGTVEQQNAMDPIGMNNLVVSTDPPYYDNVDYGDLSDFFYLWLRLSLKKWYPELLSTMRVPKSDELVAFAHRHNGSKSEAKLFFENGMSRSFQQIYESAREDVPVTIYYAFKQREMEVKDDEEETSSSGWETFLNAVIQSGFVITGTWPMRTEMANRMISYESNALSSSIVLVCRKQSRNEAITQREFINILRTELKEGLADLQQSNIAPVDLAQSAIGPGISVYSRYENIVQSDGTKMDVKTALQIINKELDAFLNENESSSDPESRFCVELYSNYAYNELNYGDAEVLSKAKNASIEHMRSLGIINSEKGKVSLVERKDLLENDERSDKRISTIWHMCQHLTALLETSGIEECAKFLVPYVGTLPGDAKSLAYHLFTIAEKKKWTQEAIAYNSLVTAWPDIQMRKDELIEQQSPNNKITLDRWSS